MSKLSSILSQLAVAFLGNLGPMCFGLHIGWLAPLDPRLQTPNSPLGRQLTTNEVSWIASLPTIAMLAGMPIFGWILQRATRRVALLMALLPNVVVFSALLAIRHSEIVMVMRFLAGITSAGALIVCPVYISECVDEFKRGMLCGASALFTNAGVLVSLTIGSYCSYTTLNVVCLSFPVLFLIGFLWLPESPVCLLAVGNKNEAERSLKSLRGGSSADVSEELEHLVAAQKISAQLEESTCWPPLADQAARRACFIILGLMTFQQICGITPINAYMVQIVSEISLDDAHWISSTITFIQLIASAAGSLLLIVLGRRTLLISSCWIMTVTMATTAAMLHTPFFKVSAMSLAVFVAAYSAGLGTVPFVLVPELIPPPIRGVASALIGSWVGFLAFAATKFFPSATAMISVSGCFQVFTISSLLGTVFIHLCVFETQGLCPEDIYKALRGSYCFTDSQKYSVKSPLSHSKGTKIDAFRGRLKT